MNDFEKLLHSILDTTNGFWNARYIGRACYAPIMRKEYDAQNTLKRAKAALRPYEQFLD